MRSSLILIFLLSAILIKAQVSHFENILKSTDWELKYKDSYPQNAASELNFTVSEDSVLSNGYCYVDYKFKILHADKDSLVLKTLFDANKAKEIYVFKPSSCSLESNPGNNPKMLTFKNQYYRLVVEDEQGIKVKLLNSFFEMEIDKDSKFEMEQFILNNRHNDTHKDFMVFKMANGRVGVLSNKEEVVIKPNFEKITIDYESIERKEKGKYTIKMKLETSDGKVFHELIEY